MPTDKKKSKVNIDLSKWDSVLIREKQKNQAMFVQLQSDGIHSKYPIKTDRHSIQSLQMQNKQLRKQLIKTKKQLQCLMFNGPKQDMELNNQDLKKVQLQIQNNKLQLTLRTACNIVEEVMSNYGMQVNLCKGLGSNISRVQNELRQIQKRLHLYYQQDSQLRFQLQRFQQKHKHLQQSIQTLQEEDCNILENLQMSFYKNEMIIDQ